MPRGACPPSFVPTLSVGTRGPTLRVASLAETATTKGTKSTKEEKQSGSTSTCRLSLVAEQGAGTAAKSGRHPRCVPGGTFPARRDSSSYPSCHWWFSDEGGSVTRVVQ